MALSLVGTAEGDAINAGEVTLTHPVTIDTGDVVYLAFASGDDQGTAKNLAMTTSGYTKVTSHPLWSDDTNEVDLAVFRKIMGATPDSTAVTADSGGGTDCSTAAVEQVWRGVDQGTPEDTAVTQTTGTDSSTPNSPAILTVSANTVVVSVGAGSVLDTSVTPPSGYALGVVDTAGNDAEDVTVGMAARAVAAAATNENPPAWSDFSESTQHSWCAATICIRPDTGAPATVTGSSASSLQQFTAAATGDIEAGGAAATLLQELTTAAVGEQPIDGAAVTAMQAHMAAAVGALVPDGAAAAALQELTTAATGTESFAGTAAAAMQELTADAAGEFSAGTSGTAAASIEELTAAATGELVLAGTAAVALQDFQAQAAGVAEAQGTAAVSLQELTASAAGELGYSAQAAAALQGMLAEAQGAFFEGVGGLAGVALQGVRGDAQGAFPFTGDAAAVLVTLVAMAQGTGPSAVAARQNWRSFSLGLRQGL